MWARDQVRSRASHQESFGLSQTPLAPVPGDPSAPPAEKDMLGDQGGVAGQVLL